MKLLKFISFAMFALMLAAGCSGVGGDDEPAEPEGDGSGLVATVSPSNIVANGVDTAVIDVRYGGTAVDFKDVKFYNSDDNSLLNWSSYNYTTTTAGTVTFYVTYKTHSTKNTPLTITATEVEPETKEFVHRSLIIDFTSVKCGYCPMMAAALQLFTTDEEFADRVVLAAIHCPGMGSDPFTLNNSRAFESYFGISGYPYANVDFNKNFSLDGLKSTSDANINKKYLADYVETSQAHAAKAGIAATVELDEDDTLIVSATVEAAENGSFRIGGMLLENGLTARQTSYVTGLTNIDTHNHVARIVDCQRTSSDFSGYDLGELEAGETGEYEFEWTLNESWDKDNCSIVLFVTTADGSKYTVTNAVHIDSLSGEYPFEYVEE